MTIINGHFVRTPLDATWTTGNYEPLLTDWQNLDQRSRKRSMPRTAARGRAPRRRRTSSAARACR